MLTQALLLALPFLTQAVAQGAYGEKSTTTKTTAAAATTISASSAIHTVQVGLGGLNFAPNSLTAAIGDQIEFHFASPDHSVAEGSSSNPCRPSGDSAFYSGFVKPGGEPFTVTVNSTHPMWFYCTAVGHCQAGMVGVINPSSGETAAEYANAAGKTSKSPSQPKVQGGVFAAANARGSSGGGSTGGASTTSAASAASNSAASPTPTPGSATRVSAMGVLGFMGLSVPLGYVVFAGF